MNAVIQKRVIVVLGMHRSGTSAITRALVAVGAALGDNLLPAGRDNPKGFWEDKDFLALNNRLLSMLGAAYDSLSLLPQGFEQRTDVMSLKLEAALMLRDKLSGNDVFALKDPRSCRLLPFWQEVFEHLELRVDYVIAARNPLSVAHSLTTRNQFPQRKSLWLWLQHYVQAVCETHGRQRIFIEYDQLLANPEHELQRLSQCLQLRPQDDGAAVRDYKENFLSRELRHTQFSPRDLALAIGMPQPVVYAYELLQGAATGELDCAGGAFLDAWAMLADVVQQQAPMFDFLYEYDSQVQGLLAAQEEFEAAHIRDSQEVERLTQAQLVAEQERLRLVQETERLTQAQLVAEQECLLRVQETERLTQLQLLMEREHSKHVQETERLTQLVQDKEQALLACHGELHRVMHTLHALYASKSMRITAPLRALSGLAQRTLGWARRLLGFALRNPRSVQNALLYVRTHGLRSCLKRIGEVASPAAISTRPVVGATRFDLRSHGKACVLTTQHCLFVGELIARQLTRVGVECQIIFEKPAEGFQPIPHFVICPQMFAELPDLYVAFQMEQTVSSRWLTEQYLHKLEHSFAIFDYSLTNIGYFTENGLHYQQINYMPIGYLPNYASDGAGRASEKPYDILFYGDANNERRREFISRISEKYEVKIIGNLFGEALYAELRKAKVVINVHYYEGALLETTRLYESLSLDCLIVSESSADIEEHSQLQGVVDFVEVGDVEGMLARLDYWLTDDQRREARVLLNREELSRQPDWFEYYFQRFLLASDNIDFDTFYALAGDNIKFSGNFVCLGLPESVKRRESFDRDNDYGIESFPGLRHHLGWIGCGMSYKFIMRKAAEQGLPWIIVCEDDVEFIDGWQAKLKIVLEHLDQHQEDWDVFSGFIADLNVNTKIIDLIEVDGLEIVHIDHMVSAVLNVYSANFYDAIMRWDENNHDVHTNAIDRYMENHVHIRVLTVHPFLVGHKEEQHSTLWGFENSRYNPLIDESTQKLKRKIEAYRNESVALNN